MPRQARPTAERFWEKVDRRGPDECWLWLRSKKRDGYGQFFSSATGLNGHAHRAAYELTHGSIESERVLVLHRCDNRACCNPAHLFLGSAADNTRDMMAKRRGRRPPGPCNRWLPPAVVLEIRSLAAGGMRQTAIAARFGVHRHTVVRILSGKRRAAVTGREPPYTRFVP